MKQQNRLQRFFTPILLSVLLVALLLIPMKKIIMPRVVHTFYFDNRERALPIKRISVVGDFTNWREGVYLYDRDGDGIWQVSVPLKIGWHAYRFLINGKQWIRDWQNPDYGGPYSNSLIYVDTLAIPQWVTAIPKTGSWLYKQPDSLLFVFNRTIKSWLRKYELSIELDSVKQKYQLRDTTLVVYLPMLADGEHDWQITLRKNKDTVVLQKSGLFVLNEDNQPPIAKAGHSQIVYADQTALLDGGQSFDPDFEPVKTFRWRQTLGPEKAILNGTHDFQATVRFPAPGRYRFRLTVGDSMGLRDSDETEVVVLPQKQSRQIFRLDARKFKFPIRKVALVGEFNRWDAGKNLLQYDSLSRMWQIAIRLGPGQWEYKFVLNDSLWLPDPQNPKKVADGWNGFNSLRIIAHDSTFDGVFEQVQDTPQYLVVDFQSVLGKEMHYRWIADAQNPTLKIKAKGNRLYFSKRWPEGTYYYYLILQKGTKLGPPKILMVEHYEKTKAHDFQQSPAWADTAIVYELYLRRFTREGTFESLRKQLPYLKRLGVNTLWMLPVYQSPTEHGYAPTSLFLTQKHYGSLQDYRRLIRQAHALGFKVLFDFVANHLSDQHRFVRAAYRNVHSPLRHWFYWQPDGTWGYHNDWDTLVNLNYHSTWVRHYMTQSALFWLAAGVDGFRCDVAWAVPHSFWKEFRRNIKGNDFDALLLDEVLPRQPSFHDNEFDMSYDTDFYGNILDVLHGRKPVSAIALGIEKSRENYPAGAQSLRYLENHDLPRFIKQFGPQLTRIMAVVLLTVPGTPLIYYGQEYGAKEMRPYFYELHNAKWFDFYQKLIKFRKDNKALTRGILQNIKIDDTNRIWWYRRKWEGQRVDVIINLSDRAQTLAAIPTGKIKKFWGSKFKRIGKRTINIAGNSFIVIQRDEDK